MARYIHKGITLIIPESTNANGESPKEIYFVKEHDEVITFKTESEFGTLIVDTFVSDFFNNNA